MNISEELRLLDVEVAMKIFGLREDYCYTYNRIPSVTVPHYSREMSCAWLIVNHMLANGSCPALIYDDFGHWALALDRVQSIPKNCDAEAFDCKTTFFVEKTDWYATPCLAIVHTALKQVAEGQTFMGRAILRLIWFEDVLLLNDDWRPRDVRIIRRVLDDTLEETQVLLESPRLPYWEPGTHIRMMWLAEAQKLGMVRL